MAGKIPEHFIQDLLARTDLVDLIESRVPLKRSGSNYMARCPFHNEKTPSFSVNRDKQFYYCFGCGASGTAISFLMDYDRLTFPEAIETLADALGLTVPSEQGTGPGNKETAAATLPLFAIQDQACRFYQQQLKSHPAAQRAVDYLRERGVSGELALRYRLGYAPPGAHNLPAEWPAGMLDSAGLRSTKEPGRSHDWFRDRIVFPIRDRRGRIVGFGGRIIGDGVPKYLNSPETAVFRKHCEVYGLFELLQAVRRPERIVVVEGYMDVIALAQFGIPHTVATLGTATSGDQVGLLFRYTQNIVFCFDGDMAGKNAAWKALESSLPHLREGRQLHFLMLPEGHDPDSLIREEGTDAFLARINAAQAFSEYFFEHLSKSLNSATIEGRAVLVDKARPMIQKLPGGVFRDMIEQRLEALSGHSVQSHGVVPDGSRPPRRGQSETATGRPSALRTFLALLLQNPQLVEHIDSSAASTLAQLDHQGALLQTVIEFLHMHPHISSGGLFEGFRGRPEAGVIAKLLAWNPQVAEGKVVETFLDHLRHLTEDQVRENRLDSLIQKSRREKLTVDELMELKQLTVH
ncbi:MAG: DNA primase [Methylococcaceae bacterium]|nr:DNA primase [Methylococcaceae bacterium]